MAANIRELLLQLGTEIVSGGNTLYMCNLSCDNVSDETDHRILIAIWMASSALILLFAIIVPYLTYRYVCYKCMHGS